MSNDRERVTRDDEIDLIELIRGLWQQKLIIILTTLLVGGAALAYALLSTPVYEAKVFVLPPSQNDIANLNYGRGGDSELGMLKVKDVYDVYVRNLQSESLRRRFFEDVYLLMLPQNVRKGSQDDLYRRLGKMLVVAVAGKETPNRFVITVDLSDPKVAASWAVKYAEMAGEQAKLEVLKDVKSDATVKASNLERTITAARESARGLREDQIAQLKEALIIAKSVDLERSVIAGVGSPEVPAALDGALTYMRGSRALQAEIDNLERRTSDDPFIEGLREKQSTLMFYRSLDVDKQSFDTYRLDGGIELPDSPVRPKKLIIIVLGVLVGGLLGVLLALLCHLWSRGPAFRPSDG